MPVFAHAHATHPDAHMALALAAAQIEAQRKASGLAPTLGWVYLTEAYAPKAPALLAELRLRWPGVAWVGASGVGVCASGVEYFDEPALVLMLGAPPRDQFHLFSGTRPLGHWPAECAQVHADGGSNELPDLIADLAGLTRSRYLFGGLASGRRQGVQIADGVWQGGLSGVAFGPEMRLISRVSQGCQALGPEHRVSACQGNLITGLDGQPALGALLQDLGLPAMTAPSELRESLPRLRRTLVGLRAAGAPGPRGRSYGPDVQVRHLIGIDPAQGGVAVAEQVQIGQILSFCERSAEAARRDLLRICTEIREECETLEAASAGSGLIAGAVYISCAGRGGPHFGAPSAELQWLRHALGDVPLVGFFAGGEIAHDKLYGYTGVLTVFLQEPA